MGGPKGYRSSCPPISVSGIAAGVDCTLHHMYMQNTTHTCQHITCTCKIPHIHANTSHVHTKYHTYMPTHHMYMQNTTHTCQHITCTCKHTAHEYDCVCMLYPGRSGFWSTMVYPLRRDLRVWYNSVEACYQSEMMVRVVSLAVGIVTSEAYYLAKLVNIVGDG